MSALTKISQNNHIIRRYGKIKLKDYITSFIKKKMKIVLKSLKKETSIKVSKKKR